MHGERWKKDDGGGIDDDVGVDVVMVGGGLYPIDRGLWTVLIN